MKEQIPVGGKAHTTDATEVLSEIHAGVFLALFGSALTAVARNVIEHHKAGEVKLKFGIKQMGESCQVIVETTMDYAHPTLRGKQAERVVYQTPMHVGPNGSLSITPQTMELGLKNGGHPHVYAQQP